MSPVCKIWPSWREPALTFATYEDLKNLEARLEPEALHHVPYAILERFLQCAKVYRPATSVRRIAVAPGGR